jgi:hypothetical protein
MATSLRQQPLDISTFEKKAFFKVNEVPGAYLHRQNELDPGVWVKSPDKKVLVRDDGSYISTVGKNYSIVDNRKFFNNVINALDQAEIPYKPKQVFVEGNGRRTTMIAEIPKFNLFEHDLKEAQNFELRIQNSFDTTLAADTIAGFIRLVCYNGMTSFTEDFKFRMIHKGDIELKTNEAIELYKSFDGIYASNRDIITNLGMAKGNKQAIADYIGDGEFTTNGIFNGRRWAKKLLTKWQENNETNNLWELYNMFTYIASHEYGNSYSSKLNAMDKINKEARTWPKRFKVVGANPFNIAA